MHTINPSSGLGTLVNHVGEGVDLSLIHISEPTTSAIAFEQLGGAAGRVGDALTGGKQTWPLRSLTSEIDPGS